MEDKNEKNISVYIGRNYDSISGGYCRREL
jgi:hypothetical protein